MGLAPHDLRRRPVVHTPVVVHGGGLAWRERPARGLKARVRELRGGAQSTRPGHRPAVEAVDRRVQVDLGVARVRHLGDVGDPQLIGAPSAGAVVVPGAAGYLKETGNRRRRQTGRQPQSLSELAPAPHRGRKGVRASLI